MSQAEAVHTLQPAAGATDQIVRFASGVRYDALPEEARHYARRHLLDTVGVMIAGAGGTIATQAETVIKAVRPAGKIPVAGRARRADLLDAAFLGGTAAHGIELDAAMPTALASCGVDSPRSLPLAIAAPNTDTAPVGWKPRWRSAGWTAPPMAVTVS
jgi:hypothetical protein